MSDFNKQLKILAIKRRPEACLGCGFEHNCSVNGCRVINQALQEKAERDKMRCENCEWFDKDSFFADDEVTMSEQTFYACVFYGDEVPEGIPVKQKHFCSKFELKESEEHHETD